MLFYGIVSSILLCFLIKRIFSFLNFSQLMNYDLLNYSNSTFFIRNQNFLKRVKNIKKEKELTTLMKNGVNYQKKKKHIFLNILN